MGQKLLYPIIKKNAKGSILNPQKPSVITRNITIIAAGITGTPRKNRGGKGKLTRMRAVFQVPFKSLWETATDIFHIEGGKWNLTGIFIAGYAIWK